MVLPGHLFQAVSSGDFVAVGQFLESSPERVNEDGESAWGELNLLHVAVIILDVSESTEMVRYLISRGADVECRNKRIAPLQLACIAPNPEAVAVLLEAGASVHRIDEAGSAITSTLITGKSFEDRDVVQLTDSIFECLKLLLRAGLALDVLQQGTITPLEQIIDDLMRSVHDAGHLGRSLDLVRAVRASVYTSASSRICPWRQYVLAPSVAVLRLRSLVARGRARERGVVSGPTPRPIAWLLAPRTPGEIVWKVLAFWNPRQE